MKGNPDWRYDQIFSYIHSDALFYWPSHPKKLRKRYESRIGPILSWFESFSGQSVKLSDQLTQFSQSENFERFIRSYVKAAPDHRLEPLLHIVKETGSVVLAIAAVEKSATEQQILAAHFIDQDHNQDIWGKDPEAQALRKDSEQRLCDWMQQL